MNNQNKPIFQPDGKNSIHDGIEHEPSAGKALIDPTDTLLLLLDHQSGLFQNGIAELSRRHGELPESARGGSSQEVISGPQGLL